ncbi:hypothetical protein RCL_jg5354.t1 [Rhizophagus clarus]|uniref:Uncharacterized protein n=1 Tax=Rhizophagus clarus TaxID=94130 RepID=A0A8H3LH66_9GLOM|nr:hypothetical protein RCL_jg5354.t1 [Rhizophagus clarus]
MPMYHYYIFGLIPCRIRTSSHSLQNLLFKSGSKIEKRESIQGINLLKYLYRIQINNVFSGTYYKKKGFLTNN